MSLTFKPSLDGFDANSPPEPDALEVVEAHFQCVLPLQYKAFMSLRDGGEGFTGKHYLVLWRATELIELNRALESDEYAPGLLLFGSDRGGEAFAFDRRDSSMTIRMVPLIGMCLKDAVWIADSFNNFIARLAEPHGTLA